MNIVLLLYQVWWSEKISHLRNGSHHIKNYATSKHQVDMNAMSIHNSVYTHQMWPLKSIIIQ